MDRNEEKAMNPVVRKCLTHLEVIGADEKTRQIVYMYMKTLDDEISRLKDKGIKAQKT